MNPTSTTQTAPNPRAAQAILGALTADAASLGLHWIYDTARLDALAAQGEVTFLEPDAARYADGGGYFAHGAKRAGELSGYGETCALMLRHLAARQGHFDLRAYQAEYRAHFGPGGAYVGYVDSPTRRTLLRLLPCNGPEDFPQPSGVDDDQLPALATLPALVAAAARQNVGAAALAQRVEAAVRVTHDNDVAVSAAQVFAQLLAALLGGATLPAALATATRSAPAPWRAPLEEACALPFDIRAAGTRFGIACHLPQGLPLAWHLLTHARDYQAGITTNILSGGDSCGRAIIVGAALGAAYGVPLPWLGRVRDHEALGRYARELAG